MVLPTWKEINEKMEIEELNPLEYFIHEYELAGEEDELFRKDLENLINFFSEK
jgi:hypothetical protein